MAHDLTVKEDTMCNTTRTGCSWTRRITYLGIGGLLFLGDYLTALWASLPTLALTMPVQAAESYQEHGQQAQHDHKSHEVDLAPFMIRNAYHFATLYHAARAERWELAAYQAEELEENLTQAAHAGGPYSQSLQDFLKEYIQPLQQTITSQNVEQFRAAFQAAVGGCNDCHKATQHGFITIPQEPPVLSIFVFPPAGK
jgi:hypothetical protein